VVFQFERNMALDARSPANSRRGTWSNCTDKTTTWHIPTELFPVEVDPFFVEDLRQMARAGKLPALAVRHGRTFITGTVLEVGGGIGNFTPETWPAPPIAHQPGAERILLPSTWLRR